MTVASAMEALTTEVAALTKQNDQLAAQLSEAKAAAEAYLGEIKIDQDVLNRKVIELAAMRERAERAEQVIRDLQQDRPKPSDGAIVFEGVPYIPSGEVRRPRRGEHYLSESKLARSNYDFECHTYPIYVPWHPPEPPTEAKSVEVCKRCGEQATQIKANNAQIAMLLSNAEANHETLDSLHAENQRWLERWNATKVVLQDYIKHRTEESPEKAWQTALDFMTTIEWMDVIAESARFGVAFEAAALDRYRATIPKAKTPAPPSAEAPTGSVEPMTFEKELAAVLNRFNKESVSNTPDFVLAYYLKVCLDAFNVGVSQRERWFGRDTKQQMDAPSVPPVAGKQSEAERIAKECNDEQLRVYRDLTAKTANVLGKICDEFGLSETGGNIQHLEAIRKLLESYRRDHQAMEAIRRHRIDLYYYVDVTYRASSVANHSREFGGPFSDPADAVLDLVGKLEAS